MSEPLAEEPEAPPTPTIRVWDAPVRIVHWGFVLLIPAMWVTAETGRMELHRTLGYVALALLIFRIYWGFAGSGTARFASFVSGPGTILRYLRGGVQVVGHNPLGALSVVALLGLLALQIGLGLFAQDSDGLFAGPLAVLVDFETSDAATEWHEALFNPLVALIALHIAAVVFYLVVRSDNLLRPMVTGRKRVEAEIEIAPGSRTAALVGIVLSVALTLWIAAGLPPIGQ